MSKKKAKKKGSGKILDAWVPPENAGHPIGCIATSFTFAPPFFEEECVSRFLNLEADQKEDGPAYIVEREEKLSAVACVSALVDQHYCRGPRNLRWDLLSARIPKGFLHAKVSLLRWSNLIRLIIASANLTEDGYRRNREIFGFVDYIPQGTAPLACLTDAVAFLREAVSYAMPDGGETRAPAIDRWNAFLEGVLSASQEWGTTNAPRGRKAMRISTLFSGPGRNAVFDQLSELWPDGSPPRRAYVTSPFFDPPDAPNKPASEIWNLLAQRGKASVTYNVIAEEPPDSDTLFIQAPESLLKTQPESRSSVSTHFDRIRADRDPDGEKEESRPLHLKSIWLENDEWASYMIGSSNFTSAGLGLSRNPNLEANLVFSVCQHGNRSGYKGLENSYLEGEPIDLSINPMWKPVPDEDEDSLAQIILLPAAFGQTVYSWNEKKGGRIGLTFASQPPAGWTICPEGKPKTFYGENEWKSAGCPPEVQKIWDKDRPPSGFEVSWDGSNGSAWWPVNVLNAAALPPPEELKNIPLDILIEILTSARPLHQVLKRWLNRKLSHKGRYDESIIDPHKRVDTSAFLLQRTRRISWALTSLRERLERPAATKQALEWRLRGPVGVMALSRAIAKEAGSDQEKVFLRAELALELARVKPRTSPGCIDPSVVKKEIAEIIDELRADISAQSSAILPGLQKYVNNAFQEAIR